MRKLTVLLLLGMLIAVGTFSCKQATKNLRPMVTGGSGELLVIINETLWKDAIGDTLRLVLKEPQIGLPQTEPLFNLLNISHDKWGRIFKTHRSILDINVNAKIKKPQLYIKNEYLARTQSYMRLDAPDKKSMLQLLNENKAKIISYFYKGEIDRKKATFRKNVVQSIFYKLKDKYNFTLTFPAGYRLNKDTLNFMWISNETPTYSKGMFIYSYEYTSEKQFEKEAILKKRNELLKKYIPGPTKGSYMSTETIYPVSCNHLTFYGNYAMEARGLWKVENDFMGGPFLNITFLDKHSNKLICLDAYVYYPNKNKREMLRELEAIMYSYASTFKKEKE